MNDKKVSILVDTEAFSVFIERSKIFDRTRELMRGYLTNWYSDNTEEFIEYMRADLTTVLKRYQFYHEFVSITKNFNFDPPIDTVSCIIRITDAEGDCCTRYRAIFDARLNVIDDTMKA